jgi:hypothetical protein
MHPNSTPQLYMQYDHPPSCSVHLFFYADVAGGGGHFPRARTHTLPTCNTLRSKQELQWGWRCGTNWHGWREQEEKRRKENYSSELTVRAAALLD